MDTRFLPVAVRCGEYSDIVDITELLKDLGIPVLYLPDGMTAPELSIPLIADLQDQGRRHVDTNCTTFFRTHIQQLDERGLPNPFSWTGSNPLSLRILSPQSIRRTFAVLAALHQRYEWMCHGCIGYPGIGTQRTRRTAAFREAIDSRRGLYQEYRWGIPHRLTLRQSTLMREITKDNPYRRTRRSVGLGYAHRP